MSVQSSWQSQWPELFEGLSADEVRAVTDAVANNVLEGWQPTRAEIALLCDQAAGRVGFDEYATRSVPASQPKQRGD
jgi:hypothetical protein